jgi:hypothetical protein
MRLIRDRYRSNFSEWRRHNHSSDRDGRRRGFLHQRCDDSDLSDDNSPGWGETNDDVTIMGTAANEQNVVSSLTASGLLASISVNR